MYVALGVGGDSDKSIEAQDWDILRMDWPLTERILNYSKTWTKWTKQTTYL